MTGNGWTPQGYAENMKPESGAETRASARVGGGGGAAAAAAIGEHGKGGARTLGGQSRKVCVGEGQKLRTTTTALGLQLHRQQTSQTQDSSTCSRLLKHSHVPSPRQPAGSAGSAAGQLPSAALHTTYLLPTTRYAAIEAVH